MEHLVQESLGGTITHDVGGRVRCQYPGRLITRLIVGALVVCAAGVLAVLALVAVGVAGVRALPSALGPAIFGAYWVVLLRIRLRRMGTFVIDTRAGILVHLRGVRELQRWPLAAVRFGTALDPFHRGWGFHHWITARVPDGRRLRLGKGTKDEIQPALRLFARLGLVVDAAR